MSSSQQYHRLNVDRKTSGMGVSNRVGLVEKSIISKLNRRIFTITSGIIFFAFMDRGNLALAANGLCEDLKLNHREYGIGVGLFFLGYFFSQLASNILLKKFGAPVWLSIIIGAWGIVAACFALIQSPSQFYVLRVLLGFAEGGTYPGIWYYLTLFYPDRYLSQAYSKTISVALISLPAAIPIAAGLLQLDGFLGVEGWRHLFFVEGVLPFCYAFVILFMLPQSFEKASFLTEDEKAWIAAELGADREQKSNELSTLDEIKTVLKNRTFWVWEIVSIIHMSASHTLPYWLTLIIKDMLDGDDDKEEDDKKTCGSKGKHETIAVLLTAIPLLLGSITCYIGGALISQFQNQSKPIGFTMLGGAVMLASWTLTKQVGFAFGFLSLSLAMSLFPIVVGPFTAIVATLFDQSARSAALSIFNSLHSLGPIWVPPVLGALVDSYGDSAGIVGLAALGFLAGTICLSIRSSTPEPRLEKPETIEVRNVMQS